MDSAGNDHLEGEDSLPASPASPRPPTSVSPPPPVSVHSDQPEGAPLKLVVAGGGKMGSALVSGLLAARWAPAQEIAVAEPFAERRQELGAAHPGLVLVDDLGSLPPGTVVDALVAVKPDQAVAVCRSLAHAGVRRVLSIVAGIPSGRLEAVLPDGATVIRAMPNTPALVGAGASAISGGSVARAADLDWAEGLLSAVGTVVRLPERYLDAVTGLSGSGPAYVFLLAEALIEAGVLAGLPREASRTLVLATLEGSAKMLQGDQSPESLRAAVTSPGGTTAAGLRALEARAVRSAFLEAVLSATERSRQLGR